MSISPLHGGLVFLEDQQQQQTGKKSQNHQTASQQEEEKTSIGSVSGGTGLNDKDINEFFNPRPSDLSLEDRIKTVLSVGEEVIQPDELRELLLKKSLFNCYDGFEPSGRMHIAQGIMKAINVNKITSAGGIFIFWVADWFALLNNKMGGDLEKI